MNGLYDVVMVFLQCSPNLPVLFPVLLCCLLWPGRLQLLSPLADWVVAGTSQCEA